MIRFKIRKLRGYIFHLHLVTEGENIESCVVTVKLLSLNYGIFRGPHLPGTNMISGHNLDHTMSLSQSEHHSSIDYWASSGEG